MFKNNKYNKSAFWLYMTYFLSGISSIIISQNSAYFSGLWHTDLAGVFDVIVWTGIGKFVFLIFSGVLADKVGRKPVIAAGMLGYVVFFGALLGCENLALAKFLSFLGGAAASLFDGAVNPAMMEIYPNNKSLAGILNKAFMSLGSIVYPLFVGWVSTNPSLPQNLRVLFPTAVAIIVFIAVCFVSLPDNDLRKEEGISAEEAVQRLEKEQAEDVVALKKVGQTNVLDMVMIALFAFLIYSSFYLFQQAGSNYATAVVGMDDMASRAVVSYYQTGSFIAVIVSAVIMAAGVRDMTLLVVYPLISTIAAFVIFFHPTALTLNVGGFVIGFAAAGGALQMGNSLMGQFFDTNKGRNTSIYYLSMSVGSIIMPKFASYLAAVDNHEMMMFLVAICSALAFLDMVYLAVRYRKVFGISPFARVED